VPFARAAELFARFTGVAVSEATARRLTEAAGAAAVAAAGAEAARLEREAPPAPLGPAVQQLSVDGAMVPLVGGAWAEVKSLVVGTVAVRDDGPRLTEPSYFSRLADHAAFARLALAETHRRGTETAGVVVGVVDGAEWCQGFLDRHRRGPGPGLPARGRASGGDERVGRGAGARAPARGTGRGPGGAAGAPRGGGWPGGGAGRLPRLPGAAAAAGGLPRLRRRIPDRQRCGRERQQAGGRGAAEGGGDALGTAPRRLAAGAAGDRLLGPVGRRLAGRRRRTPGAARLQASRAVPATRAGDPPTSHRGTPTTVHPWKHGFRSPHPVTPRTYVTATRRSSGGVPWCKIPLGHRPIPRHPLPIPTTSTDALP